MLCECKKKYDETCVCASNNLKFMDMCSCNNCDNKTPVDETYDDETNDSLDEYSGESDYIEPFPLFETDAIFFIHDIWERYLLAFVTISSILDFSKFKAPEIEIDKS